MGKPRIAEEDYIDPESLLLDAEYQVQWPTLNKRGQPTSKGVYPWLRVPAYKQGHLLAPDGMTAYCGRPLYPPAPFLWDAMRSLLVKITGDDKRDPGEWYVAHDRRKGGKCAQCKPKDGMPVALPSKWEENELLASMTRAVESPSQAARGPKTPADRVQAQRFLTKTMSIARQLGATLEH